MNQDYQLAAGISKDVEADDSILEHTKTSITMVSLALLEVLFRSGRFEGYVENMGIFTMRK
jgi:hypothetical protein